jgi:hypothetical protein
VLTIKFFDRQIYHFRHTFPNFIPQKSTLKLKKNEIITTLLITRPTAHHRVAKSATQLMVIFL